MHLKEVTYGCVKSAERWPRKRELAAADPRIGKIPDSELAVYLGIGQSTVRLARTGLGLPKYTPYRRNCSEEILDQKDLGHVADLVIAKRLGIAKSYVQRIRSENGVESTCGWCTVTSKKKLDEPPNEVDVLMQGWGR